MMNMMIIGIVSTILSIIAFVINAKVRGEEINTTTMLKMGSLGFIIGLTNIFALQHLGGNLVSSTPEFMTGTPDF